MPARSKPAAAATPATAPGRTPADFTGGGYSDFEKLGWVADGKVRGQYTVTISGSSGGALSADTFAATATSDVDGDSTRASYSCDKANKGSMISANNVY